MRRTLVVAALAALGGSAVAAPSAVPTKPASAALRTDCCMSLWLDIGITPRDQ